MECRLGGGLCSEGGFNHNTDGNVEVGGSSLTDVEVAGRWWSWIGGWGVGGVKGRQT